MKNVKKLLALLLTLAMLASVPVVAFAAEPAADVFSNEVQHSITTEEKTGNGLAFLFTANVSGATKNAYHEANYDNATVTVNGVEYQVVKMGAVMANQAVDIARIDSIVCDDANEERTILNVEAKKLYETDEDSCAFVVRITNLPAQAMGRAIAARPYIVLKDGDEEFTVYGNSDIATYNQVYYQNNPDETPVWTAGVPELDDKIEIADASAEYVAYETVNYKEAFKVTATLENVSANAKTSVGDTITYVFKDADGNELGDATVTVDELYPKNTLDVEFYAPVGTASIEVVKNLNYVPNITLPTIGSDIDVTKKKDRIRVSAASASFNEDGTIHVKLTFRNYTSNWITEETDYVQYTYYNAAGTKIKTETIYIGVIDTKKNPVKIFEFDLPTNAASVKITKSKIVYWTEWA